MKHKWLTLCSSLSGEASNNPSSRIIFGQDFMGTLKPVL